MCTVCGCGDKVTIDGMEFTHAEAHRLGLAHSHAHDHAQGGDGAFHLHFARGTARRHGDLVHDLAHGHHHTLAQDHARPDAQDTPADAQGRDHLHYGNGPAGVSVPGMSQARLIEVETSILAKNDAIAASNRRVLQALGVLALNFVSSPGSGKTTLLCRTIRDMGDAPLAVIEGDQQTSADADRIRATGARAIQINTGKGCHLDAAMVGRAIDELRPRPGSYLFIENVGNLVCPAAFDLGEAAKVAILSVTEGEDKPLKYPDMFTAARLAVLNKTDLAPHCDVDLDLYEANLRRVNPAIDILRVSARTGEGMPALLDWLRARRAEMAA
jgi:hydrogenase nickel incorporation protein HypB